MSNQNDDVCPKWDYDVPQFVVRWILEHGVIGITKGYDMISEDEYRNWVDLKGFQNKTMRVYEGESKLFDYMQMMPLHCNTLYSFKDEWHRKFDHRIDEIDRFLKTHRRDWTLYNKLKNKFEGANLSMKEMYDEYKRKD